MILNNKMFKLSSLCIMGTVAVAMSQIISSHASIGVDTVSKNKDEQSGTVVEQSTGIVAEQTSGYDVLINDGKVEVQETSAPTSETPEEAEEKAPAEEEFIEGAVKGVNYKDYINYNDYINLGINNAGQYLNVRKAPGKNNDVVCKMPPLAGAIILGEKKDTEGTTWAKVKSGDVTGYVIKSYMAVEEEAQEMIKSVGRLVIKVDCDILNIREKASTTSEVLFQISKGEELDVIAITDEWVEVGVDVGQETAFVSKEYVKITYELYKAIEIDEILYGYSSERIAIVNKAKEYLGNKYVYGGTSLTNGIDCSGFMMRIYEMFGYDITRTSRSQATQGKQISKNELKPGDLVFYGRGSSVSSIYHVAMYIGNGKIIHASNPRSGIKISNMNYTTPCRYVSILND